MPKLHVITQEGQYSSMKRTENNRTFTAKYTIVIGFQLWYPSYQVHFDLGSISG